MSQHGEVVKEIRQTFMSGRTRAQGWRESQLRKLLEMLEEEKDTLHKAVYTDLRKSKIETDVMEINMVNNETVYALKNLTDWIAPEMVKKNLLTMMDDVYIRREPMGVVLIMGAWNYPIQLIFLPLIGAIAAGNCVIIKPSEISPATATAIEQIIPKYLDNDAVKVINGGISETTNLLTERFDHIFYTGNNVVARIVMEAAAKHLTPVTLELGGKSPAYVHSSSNLSITARRIAWGKFVNSGQTCIAPDYILCEKSVQDKLIPHLKDAILSFYGSDVQHSDDFPRMVNQRHFHRVKGLINSEKIAIGGKTDEADKYIEPTVMANVTSDDGIMQQEIFGPVLPIVTVDSVDHAIEFINQRERPLALYLFSQDSAVTEKVISRSNSGGVTVNDTLMHASMTTLPFGGVGYSGMGGYHGKFSFDALSYKRGCMVKKQSLESLNSIRYPPYTERKASWITMLMKKKPPSSSWGFSFFWPIVVIGAVLAYIAKYFNMHKMIKK